MGMSRVFWDSNLFIYLFEDFGDLSRETAALRQRMIDRGDQLFTSTFTLGEILVKPLEKGDEGLKRTYWDALTATAVLMPFDRDTALYYASIRRDRTIKAPDAIQLACAAQAHVDLFITNDDRLKAKVIPGIQFIAPLRSSLI
jgi:predicted nucleic acid-binding protein